MAREIWNRLIWYKHFFLFLRLVWKIYTLLDNGEDETASQVVPRIVQLAQKIPHPWVSNYLVKLTDRFYHTGNIEAAASVCQQAREIRREILGEAHPRYARTLNDLGIIYDKMGHLAAAEPLFWQALKIRRQALGDEHYEVGISLASLGVLYQTKGDFQKAEPMLRQSVVIFGKTLGQEHLDYGTNLVNLGDLYRAKQDYPAAESIYRQVLEIRRKTLGEQSPFFQSSLNMLAELYVETKKHDTAEKFYRQLLAIRRETLNGDHPLIAESLFNLAGVLRARKKFSDAAPLLQQALKIRQTALGKEHSTVAVILGRLGANYVALGNHQAAEPLFREAIRILPKTMGENYPWLGIGYNNLALPAVATGRLSEALRLVEKAVTFEDSFIGQIHSACVGRELVSFLNLICPEFFLSLVCGYLLSSPEAARSALFMVFRRKGRYVDLVAVRRYGVWGRKYPAWQAKLQELITFRIQIARKTLAGPGLEGVGKHHSLLVQWKLHQERLERELIPQIPELGLEQKLWEANLESISRNLPPESVLIEFVRFVPIDLKAVPACGEEPRQPARYLAFVWPAGEPDAVSLFDLGEAEPIDEMISRFRAFISGNTQPDEEPAWEPPNFESDEDSNLGIQLEADPGFRLRTLVFDPLVTSLGQRTRLVLAPDGDLNLLPFEVLPTDCGQRLIDFYHISYVGVGRDVVRFPFNSQRQSSAPLVVADPDYDLKIGERCPETTPALEDQGFPEHPSEGFQFARLSGTRREGEHITKLLGGKLWMAGQALKGNLKACQSPRILHLATHGFFFADRLETHQNERNEVPSEANQNWSRGLTPTTRENHFLHAGLALASFNPWLHQGILTGDAEDGLLTAEEVTGLDLLDTDLVVLSALVTGLGDGVNGDSLLGLRQGFMLAGAKTVVMSLWKTPDDQTLELMEDFYQRILAGQPRAVALRDAQLALKTKYPDPYFWGAFICLGNPDPLPAVRGSVHPTSST